MTIQEAIKSKAPFRRKGWDKGPWMEIDRGGGYQMLSLFWGDLLASDWEIKREPKEFYGFLVGDRLVAVTPDKNELVSLRGDKSQIVKVREVIE